MKEDDQRDDPRPGMPVSTSSSDGPRDPRGTHHQKTHKANPGILDWLVDFFVSPIKNAILGLVASFFKRIEELRFDEVQAQRTGAQDLSKGALFKLLTPSSPITPLEAVQRAWEFIETEDRAIYRLMSDTYMMELMGLGVVDTHAGLLAQHPETRGALNVATSLYEKFAEAAIMPAVERYFLKQNMPLLPGYADMISIYVREGYLEEKWVEIPPEFTEFMKELGYNEDWTKRLWGKHWVLPGVTLLYEMFHKKIIDYNTMVQMLKYHDFEPVWRDRLIQNAYTMIPRVDVRRAYVWGIFSAEQLQDRYERLGYSPADATHMKDIAIRFGLSAYYSRLLTVASGAFRKGQLSGGDFQNLMEVCGLPPGAQDLLLRAESMARDAAVTELGEEPRTLSASQICAAYTKGLLSLSAAKEDLLRMGYLEGDADLLLQLAAPKPASEAPSTEIVSAASLLYKNGWMSPEEFTGWLHKAKLSPEEIQVTKDAQDLRYWFDYASDLLALWKQMYAKDLITLDEFYMNLLRWGCQPDRAWAIVSLEETRKIPKPRVAG